MLEAWSYRIPKPHSSYGHREFSTDDSISGFFTSYAQVSGQPWNGTNKLWFNGKNGKVELKDRWDLSDEATPIAVDLNNDGKEEAILPNEQSKVFDSNKWNTFNNDLAHYRFSKKETIN